jgi:ParB-like chromosome segregation protein Spo0J
MTNAAKNGNGHITWTNARRKLSDLKDWADNPASIDADSAKRLEDSLAEFGQVSTIAIDPNGQIIDGHQRSHTWALSQKFGADYKVDVRIASRKLTKTERQRLAILLRSGATGHYDWDMLAKWDRDLIRGAGLDDKFLETLRNDEKKLAELMRGDGDKPVEFKEYDESIADGVEVCKCDKCGHEHAKKNDTAKD